MSGAALAAAQEEEAEKEPEADDAREGAGGSTAEVDGGTAQKDDEVASHDGSGPASFLTASASGLRVITFGRNAASFERRRLASAAVTGPGVGAVASMPVRMALLAMVAALVSAALVLVPLLAMVAALVTAVLLLLLLLLLPLLLATVLLVARSRRGFAPRRRSGC